MAIAVYNYAGAKQAATVTVPKIRALPETTLSDVLRAVEANGQRGRAMAKTRGLVSGGGRKPWRQKGTGRARAGSSRSPIWRGGGITFGPIGQDRAYKQVPGKVRTAAVQTLLARRAEAGEVIVLSGKPALEKSKVAQVLFSKIVESGSSLFVVTTDQYDATAGSRNLADVELTTVADLNLVDLARVSRVVLSKEAWEALAGGQKAAPAKKPAKATTASKPASPARRAA